MTERPILFSAPMVRALLDGSKTQTRRVMAKQPHEEWRPAGYTDLHAFDKHGELNPNKMIGWGAVNEDGDQGYVCKYGKPGDRLWVREAFYAYGRWVTRCSEKKRRDEWHFIDMTVECDRRYQYDADSPDIPLAIGRGGALPGWYKRPAIFMPRAACRIELDITGVRVERLSDISASDAKQEGLRRIEYKGDSFGFDGGNPTGYGSSTGAFRALWESINGTDSWGANPWVWVVEFKRVTP